MTTSINPYNSLWSLTVPPSCCSPELCTVPGSHHSAFLPLQIVWNPCDFIQSPVVDTFYGLGYFIQDKSPMFLRVSIMYSFFMLHTIPLHGSTTICLSVLLLRSICFRLLDVTNKDVCIHTDVFISPGHFQWLGHWLHAYFGRNGQITSTRWDYFTSHQQCTSHSNQRLLFLILPIPIDM